MTRPATTSVPVASSRKSMLNGAFGLYLVLVLAFGYFSMHRLQQEDSSLTASTSSFVVTDHERPLTKQVLRINHMPLESDQHRESDVVPIESDQDLEKPQPEEDLETPQHAPVQEAVESIPAETKSALDEELEATYNEDCVKLGVGHLEKLFAKEDACFSRKRVQQIIIDIVHNVSQVFGEHNITNFLDSGTLLGSYRHKSIIPFDQDADIGITQEGLEYIQTHPVQFPQQYYMQVYDSVIHPEGTRFPELPIRVIDRESGLYADVFVYKNWTGPDGEDLVGPDDSGCFINCVKCPWTIEEYGYKEFHIPREWIYPLVDCPFGGKTLKCPREPEKYLDYMFGASYMEPVVYPY